MNQGLGPNKGLAIAPLVLRLGVAAILIQSGLTQVMPFANAETGQTLLADAQGVEMTANWETIIGAVAMGVGALFAIGMLIRATALGTLAAVGYCVYAGTNGAIVELPAAETFSGQAASLAAQTFETTGPALLLLGAAAASLLVSGAGCLGFDCRKSHAAKVAESAAA